MASPNCDWGEVHVRPLPFAADSVVAERCAFGPLLASLSPPPLPSMSWLKTFTNTHPFFSVNAFLCLTRAAQDQIFPLVCLSFSARAEKFPRFFFIFSPGVRNRGHLSVFFRGFRFSFQPALLALDFYIWALLPFSLPKLVKRKSVW